MGNLEQDIMQQLIGGTFQIEIRNAGIFRFPSAYRFNSHQHKEIEIIFMNSGHCIIGVEDEFVPLKRGDCISISAGESHCFIVDEKEKCSITQIEVYIEMPEALGERVSFLRQDKRYYKLSDCETIKYMMENVCRIFRGQNRTEEKRAQLLFGFFQLFIELSLKLEEEQSKTRSGKAGKVWDIIRHINENYMTEINLEQLAESFGLSSRYIRKCFEKEVDMSCQQYITMLRINKAKELLWFTSDTVTEIAMKTGFNSSQYFSRVFQKYMEMTPLEYRNLWCGSKAQQLCTIEYEPERDPG
ncbi:helix-turn-helix domain-containing protein [Ruminococcus sp. 5_1_39BFAA]|uniref:AraC family transcriptional regulator n=1 Tax=Ruminococcus sp. 5_1_39BFAA TaxID=457412 RepID=UPI003563B901